jgi:hypothetical protein
MERPSINISELKGLQAQLDKPGPIPADHVTDYAAAVITIMRGLSRGDKLRVLRKAIKLLG